MRNPNFLILDEPTNDLDIVTLNVLEDFLLEFPGCLLIVTHDRYFMDKIVDHLFVFEGEGQIRDFNGNYTEYRALKKEEEREQKRLERAAEGEAKRVEKPQPQASALSQDDRKALKRLEKQVLKLEERKAELTAAFDNAALSAEQITDLSKELAAVNEELEEKEMAWMELAEQA
jgi:ABC transport system ATP-binding/permease protein